MNCFLIRIMQKNVKECHCESGAQPLITNPTPANWNDKSQVSMRRLQFTLDSIWSGLTHLLCNWASTNNAAWFWFLHRCYSLKWICSIWNGSVFFFFMEVTAAVTWSYSGLYMLTSCLDCGWQSVVGLQLLLNELCRCHIFIRHLFFVIRHKRWEIVSDLRVELRID